MDCKINAFHKRAHRFHTVRNTAFVQMKSQSKKPVVPQGDPLVPRAAAHL